MNPRAKTLERQRTVIQMSSTSRLCVLSGAAGLWLLAAVAAGAVAKLPPLPDYIPSISGQTAISGVPATLHVKVIVRNAGASPAPLPVKIKFFFDDKPATQWARVMQLGSGHSMLLPRAGFSDEYTIVFEKGIPRIGSHRFCVTVDPDNQVQESDKTNNTACYDFTYATASPTPSQTPEIKLHLVEAQVVEGHVEGPIAFPAAHVPAPHVSAPPSAHAGETIVVDLSVPQPSAGNRGPSEFDVCLVSEIGFPALDASSKDPCYMSVKFQPEYQRFSSPQPGGQHVTGTYPMPSPSPKWQPLYFTVPGNAPAGKYLMCPFIPYDPQYQSARGDASACARIQIVST